MKMRSFFTSAVMVAIFMMGSVQAQPAGAVSPSPLRVSIGTFDGKKKVKVGRVLKAVISCSKDCSVRVTFVVKYPVGRITQSLGGTIASGTIRPLGVQLNRPALAYLKKAFASSHFMVKVRARDFETNQIVKKTRSYRFYR